MLINCNSFAALGARHSSMEDLEAGKRPQIADQVPSGMTTPDPLKEDKKKDKVRPLKIKISALQSYMNNDKLLFQLFVLFQQSISYVRTFYKKTCRIDVTPFFSPFWHLYYHSCVDAMQKCGSWWIKSK